MGSFIPMQVPASDGFQALNLGGDDGFQPLEPWAVQQGDPAPSPAEPSVAPDPIEEAPPAAVEPPVEPADLEALAEAAYEEAFARGLAEGQEKAAELSRAMEDLLLKLQGLRVEYFNRSVRDVAAAINQIAARIVRRELSFDSSRVEELVLAVLEESGNGDEVIIRLAPADDRAMKDAYPRLLEVLGRDGTFRVELDGSLHPGGTVIETTYGRIDASVESQLQAFELSVAAWAEGELEPDDE